MTWVLLIVMLKGDGMVVVPGYHSQRACEIAGDQVKNALFVQGVDDQGYPHSKYVFTWSCIQGPHR